MLFFHTIWWICRYLISRWRWGDVTGVCCLFEMSRWSRDYLSSLPLWGEAAGFPVWVLTWTKSITVINTPAPSKLLSLYHYLNLLQGAFKLHFPRNPQWGLTLWETSVFTCFLQTKSDDFTEVFLIIKMRMFTGFWVHEPCQQNQQ